MQRQTQWKSMLACIDRLHPPTVQRDRSWWNSNFAHGRPTFVYHLAFYQRTNTWQIAQRRSVWSRALGWPADCNPLIDRALRLDSRLESMHLWYILVGSVCFANVNILLLLVSSSSSDIYHPHCDYKYCVSLSTYTNRSHSNLLM